MEHEMVAPVVGEALRAAEPVSIEDEPVAPGQTLTTTMQGVFHARPVQTAFGIFGHIRIFTFPSTTPTLSSTSSSG